jgi:hypothetical protein
MAKALARGAALSVIAIVGMCAFGALEARGATRFGERGSGAGQFFEPLGVAVEQEGGDIYIADHNNQRIEKFDGAGDFLLAWGWGVADGRTEALQTCTTTCFEGIAGAGSGQLGAHSAEGVAVDNSLISSSHGDVYVVDAGNGRVEKFDASGDFLLVLGGEVNETKDDTPGATEAEKNLCTAASGDVCKQGVAGTGPGQFERLNGRSVAVDATGRVFVGDQGRVQRFSAAGALEAQISLLGAGAIKSLAVGSADELYVQAGGLSGVREFEASGAGELGGPRDELGEPKAIALGPADELFVSDGESPAPYHMLEFDPAGAQLSSFDAGNEDGFRGIAYADTLESLYVLNEAAVRVIAPPPPGPLVVNESSEAIEPASASLKATLNPEGAATEYHFEYGTSTAYGESTPVSAPLDAVNEVQSVTVSATGGGFTLAFNGEASAEVPFNATAAEVQAALEAIPGLGAGQVAVSGEAAGPWSVEFTGARAGQDVPELSAEAGGLTGPEASAAVTTTTPGISLFDDRGASAPVAGLLPGTLYHFRVVATNGAQTTDGPDQTFTTLPPVLIDGESSTEVGAKSARLGAELNPLGSATEYHFEYGASTAYGTSAPIPDASAGAGHADTAAFLAIEGLTPETTYHYRVVASNGFGAVQGEDRTFTTQGEAPSALPDGRRWEMVSPADKEGVSLESISNGGAVIQAAEDGSAITYVAKAAIEAEAPSNRSIANTQVLSRRGESGWQSKDIETPHETVAPAQGGSPSEYEVFSADLSSAIIEPQSATPISRQASEHTPYLRENGAEGQFCLASSSCYRPLVAGCPPPGEACPASVREVANVPDGTRFGGLEAGPGLFSGGVKFVSASADASRVVLAAPQNLTEGFEGAGATSLYEWREGRLRPVSVMPGGGSAGEAGLSASVGGDNGLNRRGAVSTEGDRVIFTALNTGGVHHLYLRDMSLGQTVQLDAAQGGSGGGGEPNFQGANSDASKVFFTDDARLTPGATARPGEPDLYECEVAVTGGNLACALKDLSVDSASQAADVQGEVSAVGEDGRLVYFTANGVLAAGAAPGDCAQESESATCNLYARDTASGQTKLVAELSGLDAPDWDGHGFLSNLTARSSPDGRYLAFMSERSLTGYDNRDAQSGARDEEAFLYDEASGAVSCVSCDPSGARPQGVFDVNKFPGLLVDRPRTWVGRWLAGSIPGWTPYNITHSLYQSRYLSDSGRMFFNSSDALAPQDGNGKEDVYEYEPQGVGGCTKAGGCQSLISSGISGEESAFMDASADGSDAFFITAAKLSEADLDNDFDIYDAHICTAASPCPAQASAVPPPCTTTDSCRAAAAPQPSTFGPPASATFAGAGDLAPAPAKPASKPKPPTRAQLLAKALKACAKKPKRKRGACRVQAQRRYGAKKAAVKKRAKSASGSHGASGASKRAGETTAKGRA